MGKLKRKIVLLISLALIITSVSTGAFSDCPVAKAASVTVNATNFPDAAFRSYIKKKITGGATTLTDEMLTKTTSMDLSAYEIYDLTGLNYFTSLQTLRLSYSKYDSQILKGFNLATYVAKVKENEKNVQYDDDDEDCYDGEYNEDDEDEDYEEEMWSKVCLESLNLSKLTKLKNLYCNGVQLESLNIASNKELVRVELRNTGIQSLKISGLAKLQYLDISDSCIETLTVSGNTALKILNLENTCLNGTLNFASMPNLQQLYVSGSTATNMKISNLASLTLLNTLEAPYNTKYQSGISSLPALKHLILVCDNCGDEEEDEEEDDEFIYNDEGEIIGRNGIKLDLTKNPELLLLDCREGKILNLDVSKCTKLTDLICSRNFLTKLNISNNKSLATLICRGNFITNLDKTNNQALSYLDLTEKYYHVHGRPEDFYYEDCEKGGAYSYRCESCYVLVEGNRKPTEHNWELLRDRPATCNSKGWEIYVCNECNMDKLDEIEPYEHEWEAAEDGSGFVCIECGSKMTASGEIQDVNHQHEIYFDLIDVPTCKQDGRLIAKCKNCSYIEKEYVVEKVDHEGKLVNVEEPTCVKEGYTGDIVCKWCEKPMESGEAIPMVEHVVVVDKAILPTCTKSGKTEGSHCSECKTVLVAQESVPMVPHTYKKTITKASLTAAGAIKNTCSVCNKVESTPIAQISTVKLSYTSKPYTGKALTPTVTVTDKKGKTIAATNYKITYKNNTNVGAATATVTFTGANYTGSKALTFKIVPVATTLSSLTAISKGLTVAWAKKTTQVTGYQIQCSTVKDFSTGVVKKTVKANTTVKLNVTGLAATTTYYVRIRTYKTVGETNYYSAWSPILSKKTLK